MLPKNIKVYTDTNEVDLMNRVNLYLISGWVLLEKFLCTMYGVEFYYAKIQEPANASSK